MKLEEKIKEILSQQLGVTEDEIFDDSDISKDLGADSLDSFELVMAFEEEFAVEITDDDMEKLVTFGDVVKFISERLGS